MTRQELLNRICPTDYCERCIDSSSISCEECKKLMNKWFDEYDENLLSTLDKKGYIVRTMK